MEEKILQTKKNGMLVLMLTLLGFVLDAVAFVFAIHWLERDWMLAGVPMLIVAILYLIVGILLLCGLKVLKPQEALVLTLFGDYIGTLKGEGFYQPLLHPGQPRCGHPAEPERRCGRRGKCSSGPQGTERPGRCRGSQQKDLPETDDPEQRPAEDQRLLGQPGRDRYCGDLACDGYGKGCI